MKQYLLGIFSIIGFLGWGQTEAWDLNKCVEYALDNNIQIQQSEINQDLSKQNLIQDRAALLPDLNGVASHNYNIGQRIDPFTNTFASNRVQSNNFYISSNFLVFNGLQQFNSIKKSELDYEASEKDAEQQRNDIILAIVNAYLQVLFTEEIYNTTLSQLEVTEQQVKRTANLVEVGSLARGSLLDIESQLASEELALVNAENNRDLAYLNLAQLLLLDPATFKIVKPQLEVPAEPLLNQNPMDIAESAIQNQANIQAADLRIQSAEKSLAIARGARSPRLSFSYSYGTGYSGAARTPIGTPIPTFDTVGFTATSYESVVIPGFTSDYKTTPFVDQLDQNLNRSYGFNLSVPIFNKWQVQTNVNRAKLNVEMAQLNKELLENSVSQNIQQSYYDAKAAFKKYNATMKAVGALKESFKYTQERFNVGMVNTIDFNDGKNKLLKAESDLLQAKYEYIFKLKILDYYKGTPLSL